MMQISRYSIALGIFLCGACSNTGSDESKNAPREGVSSELVGAAESDDDQPALVANENLSHSNDDINHADAGTIRNGLYRIQVEIPILRDTSIDAQTAEQLRPQMAAAINSNPDWNFCVTETQTVRGDWTELMMKIGADEKATCLKKNDTSTAATIEAVMECLEPSLQDGSLSLESSMQFRFSGTDRAIQGNMSKISTDKKSGGQATVGMAVDMQYVGTCEA